MKLFVVSARGRVWMYALNTPVTVKLSTKRNETNGHFWERKWEERIENDTFLAIYLNFYELFTNNRKVDTEEV